MTRRMRLILHGKKGARQAIRNAVAELRFDADEAVPIAVDGELMMTQALDVRAHPGHVRRVLPG